MGLSVSVNQRTAKPLAKVSELTALCISVDTYMQKYPQRIMAVDKYLEYKQVDHLFPHSHRHRYLVNLFNVNKNT